MSYKLTFIEPSSKEFDDIYNIVSNTCPNECIISIDKLTNPWLEERFQARKESLEAMLGKDKVSLVNHVFHGSRDFESVKIILQNGFDSSFNKVSAYGIGTYFAANYAYSKSYSGKAKDYKVMLINDILVGKKVRGRPNAHLDPSEGDTRVDNPKAPSIYSIPNNDQCIPRYVVQFY